MITKVVNVDLHLPIYERLTAKQGDIASRFILFHLLDGDTPFDLSNRTVRVYAIKPDKTEIFNDLTINDASKGYCTLELTSQCLAAAGVVKMELYISESGKVLTSIPFELEVIACINTDNSITSTNEFSALEVALSSLRDYDSLRSEIVQARKGHQTVGKRLNNFDSQLETKASKNEIFTMANMGQDIKEAMTGGSVPVVGNNAILSNNILEGQVTPNKTTFFKEKISLVDKTKLQPGGVLFDGTIHDWAQIKYTDYIPVRGGDILNCYYFPRGVKTKLDFRMYCFYDANYEVVNDGVNALDCTDLIIPKGAHYVILTIKDIFTIEETFITTTKDIYEFYEYEEKIKEEHLPISPLNNVKIVGKNSEYKTISSALDSINDDSDVNRYTIIVCPGVYEESVGVNGNRHISIIGINKRDCIIKTTTGNYFDAPLEISGNAYIANLTCIATYNTKDEVLANARPFNYAIHVDMGGEGTCEVYNCDFISYTSSALGLGTLNNQTIKFRDCLFESFTEEDFGQPNYGAVFLHSAVDNALINQRVEIHNCIMRSKVENVMYITALDNWSSFEVALYNNILFSEVSGKNDTCVKINGTNVNITNDSFGNNVAKLNK